VTPAYAESFAHPLIESMSSGLPVVASDLPVHREICGDAAIYFPRFSPDALAESSTANSAIARVGGKTIAAMACGERATSVGASMWNAWWPWPGIGLSL
jgi:hypothetical protein